MRRSLLSILLLMTLAAPALELGKSTVDPNKPGGQAAAPAKDARLARKIMYQVKLRPISDLTGDLTKLTGVTFIAGRSLSDWRVREDCCTVWAKDIPVAILMDSIARVMKCKWVRAGKSPNWTYRLVEDAALIASIERRAAEQRKRDIEALRARLDVAARIANSETELAAARENEPALYLLAKSGVLKPYLAFLDQAADVKDAWLNGNELTVSGRWLPPAARQPLVQAVRASLVAASQAEDAGTRAFYEKSIDDLDAGAGRLAVKVYPSHSPSHTPMLSIDISGMSMMGFELINRRTPSVTVYERMVLKAYEEKRPFTDVYNEMKSELAAARKLDPKTRLFSYTQELPIDHSKDSEPVKRLSEKVEPKVITALIAELADASGSALVTDDFRGRTALKFDKGIELRTALDTVSDKFRYHNWKCAGGVVELWDANWYDKRQARVSKAWLAMMGARFRANGTLDIGDLAEIASLTTPQVGTVGRDDVLKAVVFTVFDKRLYLKLYAGLNASQRAGLFSEEGMSFAELADDQQQAALKLVTGQDLPLLSNLDLSGIGVRITCTKESIGKRFLYTLKAYTSAGPIPGQTRFSTPLYVAPPKPPPVPKP